MPVPNRLRFEVFRRDAFRCRYCGTSAAVAPLTIDHVHPTVLGGSDDIDNLVASCVPCNNGKTSATPDRLLYAAIEATQVPDIPALKLRAWGAITTYGVRDLITRPAGGRYEEHVLRNCAGLWFTGWGGAAGADPSGDDLAEFQQRLAHVCQAAYPAPVLLAASSWAGDDRTTDIAAYARALYDAVSAELRPFTA